MSTIPRKLTQDEIRDIVNVIPTIKGSDQEVSDVTRSQLINGLFMQLQEIELVPIPEAIQELKDEILRNYEETKIAAGSMVGAWAAEAAGGPITQMALNSVDWEENVIIREGNNVYRGPIGHYIDNIIDNCNPLFIIKNKTEYANILYKNAEVSCVDEDGKMHWKKLEAVTRHLPGGNLVKIKTRSGREVRVTKSKSLLVRENNKIIPKKGSEIKIGDFVPVVIQAPEVENPLNEINLVEYLPKKEYIYGSELLKMVECKEKYGPTWWKQGKDTIFTVPYNRGDTAYEGYRRRSNYDLSCIYPKSGVVKTKIPENIELDRLSGFFFGAYIAEGCVTDTYVAISNNDRSYLEQIERFCDRYEIGYHITEKKDEQFNGGISTDIRLHSVLMARLMKLTCGKGSANKMIPSWAHIANMDFVEGLIDGYVSGDGTIQKRCNSINMASASKDLILGLSELFMRYGIFGKISGHIVKTNNVGRNNGKSQNILPVNTFSIRNSSVTTFAKNIRLTISYKQELLERSLTKKWKEDKEDKEDRGTYDVIPGMNLSSYKGVHKRRNLENFISQHENHPDLSEIRKAIESEVYFDEIVSIEEVESSHPKVYDFTVADTRNFTIFGGLCVRDSFHTAGSASSAEVSSGVEGIRELINITKNPKHPSCTVIFKDGYNITYEDAMRKRGEITDVNVLTLTQDYEIDEFVNFQMYPWHDLYMSITGKTIPAGREGQGPIWMMRIYIDVYTLHSLNVTLADVVDALEERAPDGSIVVMPSPSSGSGESRPNLNNSAIIDIYPVWTIIESELDKQHVNLDLIGYENAERVFLSQTVAPRLELSKIRGISSIQKLYPINTTVWKVVKEVKYSGTANYWHVILDRIMVDSTGIGFVEIARLLQVIGASLVAEDKNINYKPSLGFHYGIEPEYHILVVSDISPQTLFDNAYKEESERKIQYKAEQKRLGRPFSLPPPVTFTKASEYIYAQTEGSNLIELFKRFDIDSTKTTSNDVNEIYKLLGVEAARTFWILRMIDVISSGGSLSLNPRHIELIADFITNQGELDPITHKGITNQPIGPMAMASFQQPVKIFQEAGFGTEEKINSVSTAIATGQRARIGGGANVILRDQEYRSMLEEMAQSQLQFDESDLIEGITELEGTFSGSMLSFNPDDMDDLEGDLPDPEDEIISHGTTVLTSGGGSITQNTSVTRENVLQVRSKPVISRETLLTALDKKNIQCIPIQEQTATATKLSEEPIEDVDSNLEEDSEEKLSHGLIMRNAPMGPSSTLEEEIETATGRAETRTIAETRTRISRYKMPKPSLEDYLDDSLGFDAPPVTSNDLIGPVDENFSGRLLIPEEEEDEEE